MTKRALFAILAAAIWINLSEFFRNEILLKESWRTHFNGLGRAFPEAPVNGAVWMLWGLAFAILCHQLGRRFPFWGAVALAWKTGFVMMWLVIGNLGVLPEGLLLTAVPLSLIEAGLAVWITRRIDPQQT